MNAMPTAPQYLVEAGLPARDRDTVLGLWRGNLGHVTVAGEWNEVRVTPADEQLFALHADAKEGVPEGSQHAGNGKAKPPAQQGK